MGGSYISSKAAPYSTVYWHYKQWRADGVLDQLMVNHVTDDQGLIEMLSLNIDYFKAFIRLMVKRLARS